jgi:hypothetical protein
VSSAILYFAIVAIWAGVLMPRWLRPGRRRRVEVTEHFEMHTEVYETEAEARPVGGSAAGPVGAGPVGAGPVGRPRSRPVVTEREITVEEDITWTEDDAAERRANILKARRRMLGTLVFLTVVALGIAVLGVAAWWVIIPPGVMLGGFVLLLREASRSDAERTRSLAHAAELRREQAEPEFEQAAPAAAETLERLVSKPVAPDVAEEAEPVKRAEPAERVIEVVAYSAEIIDISGRVSDQFYDQYTDAANRAVGD